ncbi:hypothetical protein FD06_GL000307 [Apilactobacillus ozensis DSM 23829 = JCM 17196]|uniref:HTH cro/C1-type domain-containing protein n=1 Tax=Apilactobacillus ozensis DSM 23829 = JCM 17196 TaxID=1423781 RepID=A0A0R2AR15_9LACO|nr:hypothetical protein [Apilactobacillus ozensis]KRM69248.1 hypothetical protein FD06_GL000307 [Apilactobacillus ozensis DSM 23829 = JCM 17196]
MNLKVKKQDLRNEWLKPKYNLRKVRLSNELSTEYLGNCIGSSRRQYELKERGIYPFHDYEIAIISYVLKDTPQRLFFD